MPGRAHGLPNVDSVFTWVRLTQRVPDVPLVSGMSATATIKEEAVAADGRPWVARALAAVESRWSVSARPRTVHRKEQRN